MCVTINPPSCPQGALLCFFLESEKSSCLSKRCFLSIKMLVWATEPLLGIQEPVLNRRLGWMIRLLLWALKAGGAPPRISLISQHRTFRIALPGDDPFPEPRITERHQASSFAPWAASISHSFSSPWAACGHCPSFHLATCWLSNATRLHCDWSFS